MREIQANAVCGTCTICVSKAVAAVVAGRRIQDREYLVGGIESPGHLSRKETPLDISGTGNSAGGRDQKVCCRLKVHSCSVSTGCGTGALDWKA